MGQPGVSTPVLDVYEDFECSACAWAAVRCAPASMWARYHNALYAAGLAEPASGGFPVSLLVRLGRDIGISNPDFLQCVRSQKYANLDAPVSDELINSGLNSLPALKLNGRTIAAGLTPGGLRRVIMSGS